MKSSIRWRLVMMYVLLVVIVMMVSGTMIITMIRSTEMEQTKQEIVSYVDIFIELLELEEKATVEELDLALESYFAQEQSSGINISLIEGKKRFLFLIKMQESNTLEEMLRRADHFLLLWFNLP